VVLGAAFATVAYHYYLAQKTEAESSIKNQLSAIAELKVQQILAWRRDLLGAAVLLAANPMVTEPAAARDDRHLRAWLEDFRKVYGYSEVAIIGAGGGVRIGGRASRSPDGELLKAMATARENRQEVTSDLQQSADSVYLDVVAPVLEPNGGLIQQLLYLRVDASAFLYAMIQSWPTPSRTAESLLVWAEGDRVRYLDEFGHRPGRAKRLTVPVSGDTPAAMAVRGQAGIRYANDYRGVPVIAALQQIPGTPWALVTKVDADEIYAPLRARSRIIGLVMGLLLAGGLVTVGLFWRLRQSRFYRREHLAELQRKSLAGRYAHLSGLVNDVVLLMDEEGRIIEANDRAVATYGYTLPELLQLSIHDLLDPTELPKFTPQWRNVREEGAELCEACHRRKDGSSLPVEVSSRTIQLDGLVFRQSVVRDITERKRTEEDLRRSSRAMRVLSASNQAVVRSGDETRLYQDICGAITETGGYALAWIGFAENDERKSVCTVAAFGSRTDYLDSHGITWDDSPTGQGPAGRCIRTGQAAVINDLRTDPGFEIWRDRASQYGYRSVVGLPLRCEGALIGALSIYATERDAFHPEELRLLEELAGDLSYGIEARRRRLQQALTEEAALHAANEFRTLFDSASDAIFITDFDGRFLEANQAACQRLGYRRDELLNMKVPDIDSTANEPWLAEQFAQLAAQGTVLLETVHVCRDGTEIPVEINSRVFQYRQEPANLCVVRDISDRKRAEDEARLRSLEMERARTEAENANRAKSQFLANVSHEIRTPMNGIIGMTGLLLDESLTPQQREFAETIRGSANALLGIVNDVLDLSKIEAGKMVIEPVAFDLIGCLEEVGGLMAPQACAKGLSYRFEPQTPSRYVWGDAGRIRQIVLNLVSNAIKFTDRGETVLRIASSPSGPDKALFTISVTDTGMGIPADQLPLLFRKFAQVDSSPAKKHEGTGLGLAISRQLAELIGGTLTVTSEMGKGATFVLSLCLPSATEREAGNGHAEEPPYTDLTARCRRVLVAEDNVVNQKIAKLTLEKFGCRVDLAANGREAVEMAGRFPYDLILMDCGMPEMDGYAASQEIRARQENGSRIPIVALTAHAIEGTRQQCLAAGMDDYIAKPFSRTSLEKILLHWSP
jgi:PAS domain S-box-containing protein